MTIYILGWGLKLGKPPVITRPKLGTHPRNGERESAPTPAVGGGLVVESVCRLPALHRRPHEGADGAPLRNPYLPGEKNYIFRRKEFGRGKN